MVKALCTSGNHEVLKSGVHGAAGVLAGVCAAYNLAAWILRREKHLGINVVVYSLAVAWELKQTMRHVSHIPAVTTDEVAPQLRQCA